MFVSFKSNMADVTGDAGNDIKLFERISNSLFMHDASRLKIKYSLTSRTSFISK